MDQDRADRGNPRLLETPDGASGPHGSDPDYLFWSRFAEAKTPKTFCQSWLPLQCRMLRGVKSAMVLLGDADQGPFSPVAVWPDAKLGMSHLTGTAEKSLRERRGVLVGPGQGAAPTETCQIAYPVQVSEKIHGVVVLEAEGCNRPQVQALMRQLNWGAAWLEVMIRRSEAAHAEEANQRLRRVLDLVVSALEHEGFFPSAMALVTRMATVLECDRVSLGFVKGHHVQVSVLSHSAAFGDQTNLARAIGLAMDEAVDQKAVVRYPDQDPAEPVFSRAHGELARQYGYGCVLSIPLEVDDRILGALTLERPTDKPFDARVVTFCQSVADVIAPVLAIKQREDRWIVRKVADSFTVQVKRLLGPGYMTRKLVLGALSALVIFFALFKVDYRVTADSVIEGQVKRVVAAPFDGYIKEAPIRAGDVVRAGETICVLDDRDLKLERFKWVTEREQLTKQYHQAMAEHDRPQIQVTKAKIEQANAQIDLLDEQLVRTCMAAPFDAVVMSGDLSQSLGSPVERGQVLFEVAPLDEYRVIVEVDERDIGWIDVGQRSDIIFSSIPGERFPFVIRTITPVTTAEEGRSFFRVEGHLEKASERLRPGMEGVGKITVDRRLLIWVWTHKAVDWVRLKLWRWMP
ncbi:MAG: HlyD family efflux transporter periplasmic adaptor subunit [Desulfobacteraceae bacterium]|nr:HlyD family efflux transporter periplasmic adaptor subunit [Desulfobacteraceae bacterium]